MFKSAKLYKVRTIEVCYDRGGAIFCLNTCNIDHSANTEDGRTWFHWNIVDESKTNLLDRDVRA